MEPISKAQLMGEALTEAAAIVPDAAAVIHGNREISFRDLDQAADRVATALLNLGVEKGDRVAVLAPNQPEWLFVYFAAARIGAVVVGLSIRYGQPEITYILEQSRAKVVVSIPAYGGMDYESFFMELSSRLPVQSETFFIGKSSTPGVRAFDELLSPVPDSARIRNAEASLEPEDELMLAFTSGTTGRPKGAVLTHKSQLTASGALARHVRMRTGDIYGVTIPFNHVGGIGCTAIPALLGRAACLLFSGFSPGEIIRGIAQHKPTIIMGFPTIHTMLLFDESFPHLDTRSLRLVITGGSAASTELVSRLKDAYRCANVMNLYGLTETSGTAAMSAWNSDAETVARTVGKPLPGLSVKVVDIADNQLPPDEVGEVCLKGAAVVPGYFRRPEESRAVFDNAGWLRTGDMGYLDEEGRLVLLGRKNEMYIQEGYNVYPVEVEECLASHPKVAMAAGIGIPDPVMGEVGRYYVVPKPGETVTETELWELCFRNLSDFKWPKQIVIRQELPFTSTGKVNKSVLRREFEENGK